MVVFTDAQWTAMEPLIEAVRPQTGRELSNLRRTFEAIVWRMQNGAKCRLSRCAPDPSAWFAPGRGSALRRREPVEVRRAGEGWADA